MGYEFMCECGDFGVVSTDNRSYAARLLPEEQYDDFSGVVDDAIEAPDPSPYDVEAACMAWRRFLRTSIYQCPNCGSVYVEGPDGERHRFTPASDQTPRRLFARRPSDPSNA